MGRCIPIHLPSSLLLTPKAHPTWDPNSTPPSTSNSGTGTPPQPILVLLRDTGPYSLGNICLSWDSQVLWWCGYSCLQRQGAHPRHCNWALLAPLLGSIQEAREAIHINRPIAYHPGSPRSAAVPCSAAGSSPTCYWWR